MSNYTLPKPETPHPDWSRLLKAIWDHGRDFPDPALVTAFIYNMNLAERLSKTTERREGPAQVRPSNLLSCSRQSFLLLQGNEPEPLGVGLAPSFAIGHLVESFTRAYLLGALPPGFALTYDTRVPLPAWWPNHERFADMGTNDFTIRVTDASAAAPYLDLSNAERTCVFDLKTMGQMPFTQHQKGDLSKKPDGFGYLAQVTVYAAGHEEHTGERCDAVIMGFNRNSPLQGVACRLVDRGLRAMEERRLTDGFEKSLAGADPGLEFARWGKADTIYCPHNSSNGRFCSMRHHCQARALPV